MADYSDPIEAAKRKMIPSGNQSYFPAANNPNFRLYDDRSDLLKETENTFYGGGNSPPAPTPTPTPSPQSYQQSYSGQNANKFQVPVTNTFLYNRPTPSVPNYLTGTQLNADEFEQMRQQYGYNA